jgi:hypothetical protein
MSNAWDDIRAALARSKDLELAVSNHSERFAEMLNRNGNLRRVSIYELKKMKRELAKFDAKTGRWKT